MKTGFKKVCLSDNDEMIISKVPVYEAPLLFNFQQNKRTLKTKVNVMVKYS